MWAVWRVSVPSLAEWKTCLFESFNSATDTRRNPWTQTRMSHHAFRILSCISKQVCEGFVWCRWSASVFHQPVLRLSLTTWLMHILCFCLFLFVCLYFLCKTSNMKLVYILLEKYTVDSKHTHTHSLYCRCYMISSNGVFVILFFF